MRAQLSLEFLIITAMFTASFLVIASAVLKLKSASDLALEASNAKSVLSDFYFACERAKITGEQQKISITSAGNYVITSNSSHLLLFFENRTMAKQTPFECSASASLKKGLNELILQ
ncbi:MAG: hypothetical protein QXO69_01720 [archaeon]